MDTTDDRTADPLLGVVLDRRYRLDGLIARGGMATVYHATDERLERPVAVKVMHRAFAADPEFVARFTREARSAARLSATEVVSVFDQGHDENAGLVYLVMEHVPGRDLRALLLERGALSPARALSLLDPVLVALAAAHAAGIVHRDVKPENVLLGDDGRVKVADFGLARAVEAASVTATTGVIIGTVAYLAPEQIEHGRADPRTDVYAAGVMLWECLTGRAPHLGDNPMQVLFQHVNTDVPPPSSAVRGIPAGLDDLVVRATRRDPELRPPDAAALLAEVRALRDDLPTVGARHDTLVVPRTRGPAPGVPTGPDEVPRRRPRRSVVVAGLVLTLGLLASVGGWWLASGRYTGAPALLTLPRADAEAQLRDEGLVVRLDPAGAFSETVPAGAVLDQRPDPGGRVLRDGAVTIVLSRGPDRREVPRELEGATEVEATRALEAVGLSAGPVTREYSTKPIGTVLFTDPLGGVRLRPETTVGLVLSRGIEQLGVPGVVGMPRDAAIGAVQAAGFVERVEDAADEGVPEGQVIRQDPPDGTAGRGSTITLVISTGPEPRTVPGDVVGQDEGQARGALEALGLRVEVRAIPGPGVVRSVSPGEGSVVERDSTVTLYVF